MHYFNRTPTAIAQAVKTIVGNVDFDTVREHNAVLGTVEVSWDMWEAIPKHPNQRFTARHAAQLAASKVLATPLDMHRQVDVVVVGEVDTTRMEFDVKGAQLLTAYNVFKLNGHSRTLAQKEGHAPKPETVLVTIHAAKDAAESARLYNAFDSQVSSKKAGDKGQSALISSGITPTSALFQNGNGIVQALRIAEAIIDEGTVLPKQINKKILPENEEMTVTQALESIIPALKQAKRFNDELRFLDGLNITPKAMPNSFPALAAYIAILYRNFDAGVEFLNACRLSKGVSDSGKADAVFVASHALEHMKLKRTKLKGSARNECLIAIILNAFQGYLDGAMFDAARYPAAPGVIASLFDKERRAAAREAGVEYGTAVVTHSAVAA